MQMGEFKVAAGRFRIFAKEAMENEQNISKVMVENRLAEMSRVLDDEALAQEMQHFQFKQYVEQLVNHASSEFSVFAETAAMRESHALAEQRELLLQQENERRKVDRQEFVTKAKALMEEAQQTSSTRFGGLVFWKLR